MVNKAHFVSTFSYMLHRKELEHSIFTEIML